MLNNDDENNLAASEYAEEALKVATEVYEVLKKLRPNLLPASGALVRILLDMHIHMSDGNIDDAVEMVVTHIKVMAQNTTPRVTH